MLLQGIRHFDHLVTVTITFELSYQGATTSSHPQKLSLFSCPVCTPDHFSQPLKPFTLAHHPSLPSNHSPPNLVGYFYSTLHSLALPRLSTSNHPRIQRSPCINHHVFPTEIFPPLDTRLTSTEPELPLQRWPNPTRESSREP
jgi:hypothetical protein